MHEDSPIDKQERNVRIGCGALLGIFVAVLIGFKALLDWTAWGVVLILCVAVCAWASVRWGDRFWEAIADMLTNGKR